jgi:CRISPR/Cas system CSM-associated protein Csm4 (group 5 of RAMP superfamily)
MSLTEVRLRPAGPWRVGHRAGDRERVDVIYHSDALYSAVTHAMKSLGWLEEWLDATARAASPAVRFSSLFPFIGKTRLIAPPRTVWPPVQAGKLYLQGSKLVPLELARGGTFDESRWMADGASECLIPAGAGAPFHVSIRISAAVDRLTGAAEPHRVACLEFAANAGWWGVFEADKAWDARVKSALRLLADAGFGGERSRGWGRAALPQFSDASNLFGYGEVNGTWWLLSLFSPAEADVIDWSRGEYSTATRGGWTDSPAGAGAKRQVRMIEEGSVLSANALRGRAVDVAPDGFAHPVYRAGFALAVPVPHAGRAIPHVKEPESAEAVEPFGAVEEPAAPLAEEPAGVASAHSETSIPSRDREEAVSPTPSEELMSAGVASAHSETSMPSRDREEAVSPMPSEELMSAGVASAHSETSIPSRDREEAVSPVPSEEPAPPAIEEPTTAPSEEPTTAPSEEPTTAPSEEPAAALSEESAAAPDEETAETEPEHPAAHRGDAKPGDTKPDEADE